MRIALDRVGFAYPAESVASFVPALAEVDFAIDGGACCVIVGENGSGKSTLARIAAGLLQPTTGTVTVSGLPGGRDAPRVGFCFQNPDDTLVGRTVAEEIGFSLECRGVPDVGIGKRTAALLTSFGLADLSRRDSSLLSGGEKQKLAVAAAAAGSVDLLVLDEPTSHLDPPGRREFLDWLQRGVVGVGQPAPAVVLVTQYPDEAAVFDRVVRLDSGRIGYDGSPAGLDRPPVGSAVVTDWDTGAKRTDGRRVLISLRDVSQGAQPDWPLPAVPVRGVSLEIRSGDAIALVGPIGSGKTTLLSLIAGLLPPGSGSIENRMSGAEPAGSSSSGTARLRVPERPILQIQYPERALFAETVAKDVGFALESMDVPPDERERRVRGALAAFGLDSVQFGFRSPFSLSGGQARRAALAGIWSVGAPVGLLDEPSAALDRAGTELLVTAIGAVIRGGGAVVIASHDLEFARRVTGRVWIMQEGRLIADSDWEQLARDDTPLREIGFVVS